LERLIQLFSELLAREQHDFLRWAIENRHEHWGNLARQLGFENTGPTFDLNLADESIQDENLRRILCGENSFVLMEVKGQPAATEKDRVFIEIHSHGRPSSISVTQAKWIILPLGGAEYQNEVILTIERERLKHLMYSGWEVSGGDNGNARGYIVSIKKLVEPNRKALLPQQAVLC
jgi:hypothetical protein